MKEHSTNNNKHLENKHKNLFKMLQMLPKYGQKN